MPHDMDIMMTYNIYFNYNISIESHTWTYIYKPHESQRNYVSQRHMHVYRDSLCHDDILYTNKAFLKVLWPQLTFLFPNKPKASLFFYIIYLSTLAWMLITANTVNQMADLDITDYSICSTSCYFRSNEIIRPNKIIHSNMCCQ